MLVVSHEISAISKSSAAWSKAFSGSRSSHRKIWCKRKSTSRMASSCANWLLSRVAVLTAFSTSLTDSVGTRPRRRENRAAAAAR